jgi:hypothetical protein
VNDSRECSSDHIQVPLSAESRAMLEAGIRSAQEKPSVDRGSFAQYANDDLIEEIIGENREMLSELARR